MTSADRSQAFIIEAREHLAAVEESMLVLENQPVCVDSSHHIDRCFRAIHSIKGDAGFLGFQQIHRLAHAMETLLETMRDRIPPSAIDAVLSAADRLAAMVDDVDQSHLMDIEDVLGKMAQPGTADANQPVLMTFQLQQWCETHSSGLVDLMQRVSRDAQILNARTEWPLTSLSTSLPSESPRWTVELLSGFSRPELSERWGLAQDEVCRGGSAETVVAGTPAEIALELDLSLISGGLATGFSRFTEHADLISGHLIVDEPPLHQAFRTEPPSISWKVLCRSSLSVAELKQQFYGSASSGYSELPVPIGDITSPRETTANRAQVVRKTAAPGQTAEPRKTGDIARTTAAKNATGPSELAIPPRPSASDHHGTSSDHEKATTLRIPVELLDRLMTIVGELTLVRNQSLIAFADEDGPQRTIIQRLNSVTSELQDAVLVARMQPVGNLFNKFPRMIRDLARQLNKQVELELVGRDVDLDKTIIEQLSDPLTHLIRNSIDHGIEQPEERTAAGKSPVGHVVLSATHDDGQVRIEIRDDGRGIDSRVIRNKALSAGLRTQAELDQMTQRELLSLILLPGFSTAESVTEVSGRGVGMDVVRTNIEQLEGTLTIDSIPGQGCSMILRLPLTLAIIPCLIVRTGGDRFAVPQREIEEVVCLHPQSPERIEQAWDTEVYRLRQRLLPVIRFADVLACRRPFTPEIRAELLAKRKEITTTSASGIEYILVLKSGGRRFGLVVDDVHGREEVVVKPMHSSMKQAAIFNGATIMGDGRIALIADVQGIAEHARISFPAAVETGISSTAKDVTQSHRVLLFEYGPLEQFALPLLQIRRIELIDADRIEQAGAHEYITIDGLSTRILRLDHLLNASTPRPDDAAKTVHSLILLKFVTRPVGILVSRIIDTESLSVELQQYVDQNPGVLGTAVVRDRLTLFLDVHRLAGTLSEQTAGASHATFRPEGGKEGIGKRLLLIDDTAFFREVVRRYLTAQGHDIQTAVDGADALEKIAINEPFDLIVSDIEMPVMDGWSFAREARRRGIKTPMLALTSLSGDQYEAKAHECGFDGYEVKLDHDRLIRKVDSLLSAAGAHRI